jgi:2-hydroxychromene-2-carboxylate isomerase
MDVKTRIRSTAVSTLASARYLNFLRGKARLRRKLSGKPAAVHYFHQVDDPYSHLAVQKLDQLKAAYPLPFKAHLVSKPAAEFQGSSDHFENWALRDALSIAEDYGTSIHVARRPGPAEVQAANNKLASHLHQPDFAQRAVEVGRVLWAGKSDKDAIRQPGGAAVREGNALRAKLGHYLGGMFYFDGEWFWGIDRIRLLEQRLIEEGYGDDAVGLCVPEPDPVDTSGFDASEVVLEYFPSLRSPYTAIGHRRVLDLSARSGVTVRLRPVMPMLMRGIPAPFAKQQYIIIDAAREARARDIPFGRIVDPFGEPVKRAFALFPAALEMGKGMPFVTAYLSAAWAEGIDITTEAGLRRVTADAGIDWNKLRQAAQGTDWEVVLEDNLSDMLAAGLWGVPSFRVTGGNDDTVFVCWGQDRIWRVENEIASRL